MMIARGVSAEVAASKRDASVIPANATSIWRVVAWTPHSCAAIYKYVAWNCSTRMIPPKVVDSTIW